MIFISTNRTNEKKSYLRTARKKTPKGIFAAPVWVMQKTGKRLYNDKSKRSWKNAGFGKDYKGE